MDHILRSILYIFNDVDTHSDWGLNIRALISQ